MAISDWSTTPGSNGSSDASINFAEGQAPSTVNDSARSLMARVRHWFNWFGATTTSGGASNAYTLTSGESLSAYVAGMRFAWSPNADSTGAVTINVDTIGAKKVYMPDGSQANTGDLDADSIYDLIYDTALDSSAGGFKIVGFPDAVTSGALLAANNLSDLANATTARTNLGVAIGSNVQAYDAGLADIAGLAVTDGNFIVANGSNWIVESGATARTSLGLGSLATLSSVNNGNWSGTDLAVANGGTGASDAATARSNLGAYGAGDNVTFGTITASGDTNIGSGTLFADVSLTRVAIGATGANATLSIADGSATKGFNFDPTAASSGYQVTHSLTNSGYELNVNTTGRDYLWKANGSEFVRFDAGTQRVGIGTSSPSGTVHISETGKAGTGSPALYIGAMSAATESDISLHGNAVIGTEGSLTFGFESGGFFRWGSITASETGAAGVSEMMRIDSSGNVGIGTGSPGAKLDVDGETRTYAENNASVNGTLVNATHLKGAINGLNGNVTVPTATAGANGVLCGDGSARTITRGSGLTMYVNGSNSASATLAARGVASVLFTTASVCYVSGDVS